MVKGNTTGGKNYKKSKHGGTSHPYPERQKDQMWARVIKNLGNRNMQCYCNDGKTRLCHVRGSMRNRVWINVGDLILVSLREITGEPDEKGDIIAKFETEHIHHLKSEKGINPNLFIQVETVDTRLLSNVKEGQDLSLATDGFVFEEEDSENTMMKKDDEDSESSDEDKDIDIDNI